MEWIDSLLTVILAGGTGMGVWWAARANTVEANTAIKRDIHERDMKLKEQATADAKRIAQLEADQQQMELSLAEKDAFHRGQVEMLTTLLDRSNKEVTDLRNAAVASDEKFQARIDSMMEEMKSLRNGQESLRDELRIERAAREEANKALQRERGEREEAAAALASLRSEMATLRAENAQNKALVAERDAKLSERDTRIALLQRDIEALNATVSELKQQIEPDSAPSEAA